MKHRYQRFEERDANESGGKKTLNSGRSWFDKGDGDDGIFLRDVKDATSAGSISVNFKKLEKHFMDALKAGKIGLWAVYFKDSLGRIRKLNIVEEYVLDPLKEKKEDA